jgi:hypothetical protein
MNVSTGKKSSCKSKLPNYIYKLQNEKRLFRRSKTTPGGGQEL